METNSVVLVMICGVAASPPRLELWRKALTRDVASLTRHGLSAPRWCERIWLDPVACNDSYGRFKAADSGKVIGGDWDINTYPFDRNPIAAACLRRWRDGMSWEESGAYELQLSRVKRLGVHGADGCRTLEDVVRRYQRLDQVFASAKREGRLRPRNETDGYTFRERDGVLAHIARDGRPVFGHRGVHRFVIARLLGFRSIPAQVGVVHPDALRVWRKRQSEFARARRNETNIPIESKG